MQVGPGDVPFVGPVSVIQRGQKLFSGTSGQQDVTITAVADQLQSIIRITWRMAHANYEPWTAIFVSDTVIRFNRDQFTSANHAIEWEVIEYAT